MFSVFRYIISPGWTLSFRVAHKHLQQTAFGARDRGFLTSSYAARLGGS